MTWVRKNARELDEKSSLSPSINVYPSDLRRRIELIQDFSMPIASTGIRVTADGQYILASGQDMKLIVPVLVILG